MRSHRHVNRLFVASWALLLWGASLPAADARRPEIRRRAKSPVPVPVPVPAASRVDLTRTRANKLLKAGSEKMEIGLYAEALSRFRAAYALVPSPKISYNIALAYNYMARYVEALGNFETFVRHFGDHSHKYWKAARDVWIPRLKKKIATVQVRVNVPGASVTVAGKKAGVSPHVRTVRLQPEPGRLFVIVVDKPGFVHQTLQVKLRAGQKLLQKVTLISEAKALAQRKEFQRELAERKRIQARLDREQARAQQRRLRRHRQLRGAGWVALGTGMAFVLAGGVMGIVSLADKYFVEGAEEDRLFADLKSRYDRGNTLRKGAWAAMGSGLVMAAAGGILMWLGYGRKGTERSTPGRVDKPAISVMPVLSPQQVGMTLELRF